MVHAMQDYWEHLGYFGGTFYETLIFAYLAVWILSVLLSDQFCWVD